MDAQLLHISVFFTNSGKEFQKPISITKSNCGTSSIPHNPHSPCRNQLVCFFIPSVSIFSMRSGCRLFPQVGLTGVWKTEFFSSFGFWKHKVSFFSSFGFWKHKVSPCRRGKVRELNMAGGQDVEMQTIPYEMYKRKIN